MLLVFIVLHPVSSLCTHLFSRGRFINDKIIEGKDGGGELAKRLQYCLPGENAHTDAEWLKVVSMKALAAL